MSNIIEKKYNEFLRKAEELEQKKCPYCKEKKLVHADYQEHILLCSNCGVIVKYNKKTKRLK